MRRIDPPSPSDQPDDRWVCVATAVAQHYRSRGWAPTPVQLAACAELGRAEDVLIVAPTGSGKTLAASLPLLLRDANTSDPFTRVLYVAPTRALVTQQGERIAELARAVAPGLRVAIRTGDSDASTRALLRTEPPHFLVVTPESLAVVLGTEARGSLAQVSDVVLDEAHQLAEGKRGALLAATLETLGHWTDTAGGRRPRRIGLSATVRDPLVLARWLGGSTPARACVIPSSTPPTVRILDPGLDGPYPGAGWAGRAMLPAVARAIAETAGKTLVFVHSRPLAEHWTQALREILPARLPIACFHGSMSARERTAVARALTSDALRAVVTTSSLEVGVDVPEAELVVMVGAPGSVTRLVQSAGRSAHRPGGRPSVAVAALHAWDRIAAAALAECVGESELEPVAVRHGDLDVAMQAALGLCSLGVPVDVETMATVLRRAAPFAGLSSDDLDAIVLQLATGGGLQGGDVAARRIARRGGGYVLAHRASRSRYLRNVGTICSEPAVAVRSNGRVIGQIDGIFAARMEDGTVFSLGGASWRVVARRADGLDVLPQRGSTLRVARWAGQYATQSALLLQTMERLLGELDARVLHDVEHDSTALARARESVATVLGIAGPTLDAIVSLLLTHRRRSVVPSPERFVLDRVHEKGRIHLVAYTFAGGPANEVIGRAAAARAHRDLGEPPDIAAHDLGVILAFTAPSHERPLDVAALRRWFEPAGLGSEIAHTLRGSQLARFHFREVARVAQLTDATAGPGAASPELLYDVLWKFAPDGILMRALDRSLWNSLDGEHASAVLASMQSRTWCLNDCNGPAALAIPMFLLASRDRAPPGDHDLDGSMAAAAHALFERIGGGSLP